MCGGVFDYKPPPCLQRSSCASSSSGWHITNTERKLPRKIAVKSNLRSPSSSKFSRHGGGDTTSKHASQAVTSSRTLRKLSDRDKTVAADESRQGMVPSTKEDCCKIINLNMPIQSSTKPHSYALKCHKGIV